MSESYKKRFSIQTCPPFCGLQSTNSFIKRRKGRGVSTSMRNFRANRLIGVPLVQMRLPYRSQFY